MNWRRMIIAALIGFVVSTVLLVIFRLLGAYRLSLAMAFGLHILTGLIGGFVAGFRVNRFGWLVGLFAALLLETVGMALLFPLTPSVVYGERPSLVWWVVRFFPNMISYLWTECTAYPFGTLITGIIGGILGQQVAHKVSKK